MKKSLTASSLLLLTLVPSLSFSAVVSGKSYRLLSTCGTGDKVVSIANGSLNDYANAVLAAKDLNSKSQIFKIETSGTGYKLTAQHSGKVLDVTGESKVNGTSIIQYSFGGTKNQQFKISSPVTDLYRFQNVNSGLYMDLNGAKAVVGNNFILYQSNSTCAQRFKLQEVVAPTPTPSPTPTQSPTPIPTPTTTPTASLPTDKIFAPTSFWYTAIPANAPIASNSSTLVADLIKQRDTYYGNVNINTDAYSSPVYIADATTSLYKVNFNDCQGRGYSDPSLIAQWSAVPIPSFAAPATGTDMEMTIYQPSTDTIYEFWVTHNVNGKWDSCWGGRMQNVSTSSGIWSGNYGTTATGLPFLGGQVTAEELKRGEIKHAIGIALVDLAAWNIVSWPAQRSDGNGNGLIAEGQRFRLDPTLNVDALAISKVAKIIAKAAQKYGFVVWDKAGSVTIRAQNVLSYTQKGQANPYPALFENNPDYTILNGFPWNKVQFLPMNYGKQ